MKNYEKPVLEIAEFNNEDIITASGGLNVNKLKGKGENTIDF